jgi:hypothetical protein
LIISNLQHICTLALESDAGLKSKDTDVLFGGTLEEFRPATTPILIQQNEGGDYGNTYSKLQHPAQADADCRFCYMRADLHACFSGGRGARSETETV